MNNPVQHTSVDIVLPNYNSYPYLEATINSVINQTFENWKLLIVEGASNTETRGFLKKYIDHPKISILWLEKNKGAGFSRNLAIKNSEAEYIAFLDSDDIWEKEKLSKQLTFMIENNYQFTYTNYTPFIKEKKLGEICPPKNFSFNKFVCNTSIGTSTMIIKKNLIENIQFNEILGSNEDYLYKCEVLKKVNYAYCLTESLTKYRIRPNSLSSNKIRNAYWVWHINKKYNHLSFIKNLLSILCISINSIKKYGFK